MTLRSNSSKTGQTGFEILDHPADMGLRAWADSWPELLRIAAIAVTNVLVDIETIKPETTIEVNIEGEDREMLMYNWLSEVLFQFDAEGLLLSSFEIIDVETLEGASKCTAKLSGETFDKTSHEVKTYVKAITLHQLQVTETNGMFEAQIYLDI